MTGVTLNPGDLVRVRLVITGTTTTTLQAKVWKVGTTEPVSWLLTTTDATPAVLQAAGDLGMLLYVSGSWTGAPPTMRYDNFERDGDNGMTAVHGDTGGGSRGG